MLTVKVIDAPVDYVADSMFDTVKVLLIKLQVKTELRGEVPVQVGEEAVIIDIAGF